MAGKYNLLGMLTLQDQMTPTIRNARKELQGLLKDANSVDQAMKRLGTRRPSSSASNAFGIGGNNNGIRQQAQAQAKFEKDAQRSIAQQGKAEVKAAQSVIREHDRAQKASEVVQRRQASQEARNAQVAQRDRMANLAAFGSGLERVGNTALNTVKSVGSGIAKVVSAPFKALNSTLGVLGVAGGVMGAKALVQQSLDFSANMEQAKISFTTLLGDSGKAQTFVDQLFKFTAKTPFLFPDMQANARSMMAMGFTPGEIIPDLKAIGNVVASLGGDGAVMDRVVMALGHIKTSGTVTARELRTLAMAGIPAIDILSKKLGIAKDKLTTAGKLHLPADKTLAALFQGFNEKPFAGGLDAQSQSWNGLLTTIKDNALMVWGSLGGGIRGKLQPELIKLSTWFDHNQDTLDKWRLKLFGIGYGAAKNLADTVEVGLTKIDMLLSDPNFDNASLFGKVGMAWDEFIAKPFADWWNGAGKAAMARVAHTAGSFVGETIADSIKMAFGLGDATMMKDVGNTAGGQFVAGFTEKLATVDWGAVFKKAMGGWFDWMISGPKSVAQQTGNAATGNGFNGGDVAVGVAKTGAALLLLNRVNKWLGGAPAKAVRSTWNWIRGGKPTATGEVVAKAAPKAAAATEEALVNPGVAKGLGALGPVTKSLGRAAVVFGIIQSIHDIFTAQDKTKAVGREVGGWSGAAALAPAGAAIGTAIFPGVGTAIGGLVASIVGFFGGQKLGEGAVDFGRWIRKQATADFLSNPESFYMGDLSAPNGPNGPSAGAPAGMPPLALAGGSGGITINYNPQFGGINVTKEVDLQTVETTLVDGVLNKLHLTLSQQYQNGFM